ncbi:MAG: GTP cyclohydrolase I FolE2 [Candidatus Helarchaeota archaeon]|nr:GTP cyclohydrolase I FolE2 [Candidatus Helarchaeota archaeon]
MTLPDIQNTKSDYKFSLNRVGIKDIIKKVRIVKDSEVTEFPAKFSAYVDLPKELKGIHMSRNPQTIQDVLNELTFKPSSHIEEFMRKMSTHLLSRHEYATIAEVECDGIVVIEVPNERTGKQQKAHPIKVKAISKKENDQVKTRVFLNISAFGINACPCAKDLMIDYANEIISERREKFDLNEKNIKNILDIMPIATHSQRCKGSLTIEIPDNLTIDLLKLINIIENSMSAKVQDVLKRVDEAKLVRLAHLNPKFVEDSCREMAIKVVEGFPNFPDDCEVTLEIEALESIHQHNAYAQKQATFKKLREEFKKS